MNIKLKNKRNQVGLTQKEIAEKSNMTVTNYQRIEYGKQLPKIDTAKLIAKVLNCKIEDIF